MAQTLSRFLWSVSSALCEDVNTPRALTVSLLLKYGEYGQLFNLKIDPAHYCDPEQFFKDNFVTELLRKLDIEVPGIDRKQVAKDAFFASEAQCYRTNVRLRRFNDGGPFEGSSDLAIDDFLSSVRKIISEILGPVPRDIRPRHGPGATFNDRGKRTTVPDKMSSRPTITKSARCILPLWEETAWSRELVRERSNISDPLTVQGNRFTTVPKDATKFRGICIEPSLNVFYQLGVGDHLKDRLRLAGIDLREGQQLHRTVACSASITGSHATIDLSNASDTVSYQLVKRLLPTMWFELLDSLRSPSTFLDGKWYRLEKFSSMGNGYTFELESLIFSAVAQAVAEKEASSSSLGRGIYVYGDDIIVPTEIAKGVLSALRYLGFTPNPRKTFLTGLFRESCGGDFFAGKPVRAHYVKEDPSEPQHYIKLANGLLRVVNDHFGACSGARFHKRARFKCLDALPARIRKLRGPESLGDLVIHDPDFSGNFRERNGCGFVLGLMPQSEPTPWNHWTPGVVLASALLGQPDVGPTARGSIAGYRIGLVSILERPKDSHVTPDLCEFNDPVFRRLLKRLATKESVLGF